MLERVYKINEEKGLITFTFNFADFFIPANEHPIKEIFLYGCFTGWKRNPDFKLEQNNGIWSKTFPLRKILIPANSGFPEFNFIVLYQLTESEISERIAKLNTDKNSFLNLKLSKTAINQVKNTQIEDKLRVTALMTIKPVEYKMLENFVVLENPENIAELKAADEKAGKIWKLKEYKLKNPSDEAKICNVRQVPGLKNLWRGYHPYKKSRPDFDTEKTRIRLVNKALKKNKIQSVITLCGDEKLNKENKEKIFPYMKNIQKKGNQLFVDTDYEIVYFNPQLEEYNRLVKSIIEFILSHPAPFYIHCRLGSDRTGTMSAVLAALCGTPWQQIAEDYEKTSDAGFGEYRNRRLLAWSFKKLLGKEPENANLQEDLSEYFILKDVLTEAKLIELQKKLK